MGQMGEMGEMGQMGQMGEMGEMGIFHRASALPIKRSAPIERQRYTSSVSVTHQASAPPIVRRGYAKEDPLGIVQIVQPEGSYFMRWAENDPLSLSNYSSASFLRRKSFLRISLRIDCVRRSGSTLRVISES